ncbi:MAG: hypothetical protein HYU88_10240 [Chloroflexi bacterium]|nr:hypothetical protein [Chloroflexota bacterium]
MRFGVYLGLIFPGDMPGEQAYALALDMARAAGFDGIHAAHHYVMGPSHQTLRLFGQEVIPLLR